MGVGLHLYRWGSDHYLFSWPLDLRIPQALSRDGSEKEETIILPCYSYDIIESEKLRRLGSPASCRICIYNLYIVDLVRRQKKLSKILLFKFYFYVSFLGVSYLNVLVTNHMRQRTAPSEGCRAVIYTHQNTCLEKNSYKSFCFNRQEAQEQI